MFVSPSSTSAPEGIERHRCTICQGDHLLPFLDLGRMAPANALLRSEQLTGPEPVYPLGLTACLDCQLIQLTHGVPPRILFKDYVYFSSISQVMVKHFAALAHDVTGRFLAPQDLLVEIGSNDGILLQSLVGSPYRILGIDPADTAAEQARERGVPTVVDFFDSQVAARVKAEHGPAKAILGNNVLAHIPDLHETVRGFDVLAAPDGVLVFEFPYVVDFFQNCEFDTVYHEHLYYLGLRPLNTLLKGYGFHIFDARRQHVHGGSIRVFASRVGAGRPIEPVVDELMAVEASLGLDQPSRLQAFQARARQIRDDLRTLVARLNQEGRKVVGYTAPAKGNVLLNYCGLGPDQVRYLADATPAKQGLYSPGVHIPIVSPEHFRTDRPDYALLLAWNHKEEVLRREAAWHDQGGRFIIAIPQVETL